MTRVMKSIAGGAQMAANNQLIANELLAFLTDKYDTKSWFVFVYDNPHNRDDPEWRHYHSAKHFHQVLFELFTTHASIILFYAPHVSFPLQVVDEGKRNALAASVGREDLWSVEDRQRIIQSLTDFCQLKTGTNGWYSRMHLPLITTRLHAEVDRCQHHRADVVVEELFDAGVTADETNRVAVFLTSSNAANAVALLEDDVVFSNHVSNRHFAVIYRAFSNFDYCGHFRRLLMATRGAMPPWLCQLSAHSDYKSALQFVVIPGRSTAQ